MSDKLEFERIVLPEFQRCDNPSIFVSEVAARRFYIIDRGQIKPPLLRSPFKHLLWHLNKIKNALRSCFPYRRKAVPTAVPDYKNYKSVIDWKQIDIDNGLIFVEREQRAKEHRLGTLVSPRLTI